MCWMWRKESMKNLLCDLKRRLGVNENEKGEEEPEMRLLFFHTPKSLATQSACTETQGSHALVRRAGRCIIPKGDPISLPETIV